MAGDSAIEWTDKTWNPIAGCAIVSPGCAHCYAMRAAARMEAISFAHERDKGTPGPMAHYRGTTRMVKGIPVWTGKIGVAPESTLRAPLLWKKPRKIFVNSMSDLFHEDVPDAVIDRVFAVMALTPRHTYQVLTKRSARMRAYMAGDWSARVYQDIDGNPDGAAAAGWLAASRPLPNVWLGVSAEDQTRADERIPDLLATPAAVRFVSAEPLLGPIDLRRIRWDGAGVTYRVNALDAAPRSATWWKNPEGVQIKEPPRTRIDWIIVGGESGAGARPMHPDWARSIRDQCAAAGVAFNFKQWGAWAPGESIDDPPARTEIGATLHGNGDWSRCKITPRESEEMHRDDEPDVYLVGKKRAGRLLDGVEHNAFPEARS